MAALKRKNEQDLLEEIEQLKSTTIQLQSAIIDLLKQRASDERQSCDRIVSAEDGNDHCEAQVLRPKNTLITKSSTNRPHSESKLVFEGIELSIVDHHGRAWLTASDLSKALGYKQSNQITHIYRRNKNEFTSEMTEKVKLTLSGNLQSETRIFSPRGCHLIAMFARTERAAAFRRWVLDVLESLDGIQPNHNNPETPTTQSTVDPSIPFHDCGIHDAEFLAFLAVTKGRMGGRRNMSDQVSIHTAKVLRWLWYRCPCETEWVEASRIKMGQDLGMCHTTALRCAKRLEAWRFIEQRMIGRVTECKLLRSRVATALEKAGAFQLPAVPDTGKPSTALPIRNAAASIDLGRLADVAGSSAATLFLARAIECQHETGARNGGWWHKTRNEWTAETGLSRCEQESARRALRQAGILSESRRGLPAKLWYRIDEAVLTRLMNQPGRINVTGQPRWH